MNKNWDYLLYLFQELGGIAENVQQRHGINGRGIFPINKNHRSKIFNPTNLIINIKDISLVNNQIRINNKNNYAKQTIDFFNFYQDQFSYCGEIKNEISNFENQLRCFTPELKYLIKNYLSIDIEKRHSGSWDEVIFNSYLNSRRFNYYNSHVICPILELINHQVISFPFILDKSGISSPNYPPSSNELTFYYSNQSSIKRFFQYYFCSKESIVFSFPFSIKLKKQGITFTCLGKDLNKDQIILKKMPNQIIIDGLPIADINNPQMPMEYFRRVLDKIENNTIPLNFLKLIRLDNIKKRSQMEVKSKSNKGEVSNIFQKVINYEIDMISSCD